MVGETLRYPCSSGLVEEIGVHTVRSCAFTALENKSVQPKSVQIQDFRIRNSLQQLLLVLGNISSLGLQCSRALALAEAGDWLETSAVSKENSRAGREALGAV